jgi:hypothetical protein
MARSLCPTIERYVRFFETKASAAETVAHYEHAKNTNVRDRQPFLYAIRKGEQSFRTATGTTSLYVQSAFGQRNSGQLGVSGGEEAFVVTWTNGAAGCSGLHPHVAHDRRPTPTLPRGLSNLSGAVEAWRTFGRSTVGPLSVITAGSWNKQGSI